MNTNSDPTIPTLLRSVSTGLRANLADMDGAYAPRVIETQAGPMIYGIRNVAFFNVAAEGDERWFSTRAARDAAIDALRDRAVREGLAASAAKAGIRPIIAAASDMEGVTLHDLDVTVGPDGSW